MKQTQQKNLAIQRASIKEMNDISEPMAQEDNPIFDNIMARRSVRAYSEQPIPKETLKKIIQAGRYAPSAENHQPWKFIVITNKSTIQNLSQAIKTQLKSILKKRGILKLKYKELKNEQTLRMLAGAALAPSDVIFFDAPALVFIVTKKHRYYDESCACCAQNMMLAAHSLGIGSCWIGLANFLELDKNTLESLEIPEDHHISAALVFGHSEKKNPRPGIRKVTSDIIKWIE